MRNLWILSAAQAFGACGMIILVTFGGIVGARIAPVPTLATLPLALTIVGVALSTLPAALVMRRFGRKPAFIASALLGSAAALLLAWATARGAFVVFCAASVLVGINQAFVLQYRFAATEHVSPEQAGRAVGMVMVGILVAAMLGPEVGDRARLLGGWPEFTGSFLVLAVFFALGAVSLVWLGQPRAQGTQVTGEPRPLRQVAAQPSFVVAVLAAVISFAAMSFIMTATPISMHVLDEMSVTQTRQVISAHIIAMYAPSLASGWLTRVVGLKVMMLGGVALMASCVGIATLIGHEFLHYLSGLVLLGLGWNLLFVAGTTLLTRTYAAAERFKAQGFNDLATFGTQAVVSLLAGSAIQLLGWAWLNVVVLPLLLLMTVAVLWLHASERATELVAASR